MLVLSRRTNEKLLIPCIRTIVQVLSIQGGQVRLGVEAPSDVAVFREEIYKGELDSAESVGRSPAVPARVRAALRNRLAGMGLGLDRVQDQLRDEATPATKTALDQLGEEFDALVRIVDKLLDDGGASETRRSAACAR